MSLKYYHKSNCRLCSSNDLEIVIELNPTPPGNNFLSSNQLNKPEDLYPLAVKFCKNCGHVQLADVVNPEILFQDDYKYVSGTSPVFVNHFKQYVKHILKKYNIPKGSLIGDIGSNDGTCLNFFKEKGFSVLGVDPALEIAKKATNNGIQTIADFFTEKSGKDISNKFGKAHLITSHNTCAHVDDLVGLVKGVKHWLHKEGLFVFEVGYLLDVLKNNWFDTIYHEHLDYHSVKPLIPFFESLNMEVISVERISPQGGSIRVYVQNKNGPYDKDPNVKNIINNEENIGLDKIKIFRAFNEKNNINKRNLNSILERLKNKGKKIAAYGAPTKSTTLLFHFEIGKDILDFIVDDNPLKQGKFSPGYHIPIMDSNELYNKMPDYLLILAWNFSDSIINKHKRYADRGGQFILPMPDAHIIK